MILKSCVNACSQGQASGRWSVIRRAERASRAGTLIRVRRIVAVGLVVGGVLLAIGVVLWVLTWLTNRGIRAKKTGFRDPDALRE